MKSFNNLLKESQGFSLLEVLIAIFILVVGIVGVYSVFGTMIASSLVASQRLTAAYLAQEGIEIVRNIRDTNWINSTDNTGWAGTVAYFTVNNDCKGHKASGIDLTNFPTGYIGGCEADYITGTASDSSGSPSSLTTLSQAPASFWRFLYIGNNSYGYSNTIGTRSIFKRQIIVNPMDINGNITADVSAVKILDVVVNIYWQEKGKDYSFPVEEFLYNWHE